MVSYLIRWKIKPGQEVGFETAWLELTKLIYKHCGSLGSRLHVGDDGVYYAYAQWPSFESRETSEIGAEDLTEANKFRAQMQGATLELLPLIKLNICQDFLKQEPNPNRKEN